MQRGALPAPALALSILFVFFTPVTMPRACAMFLWHRYWHPHHGFISLHSTVAAQCIDGCHCSSHNAGNTGDARMQLPSVNKPHLPLLSPHFHLSRRPAFFYVWRSRSLCCHASRCTPWPNTPPTLCPCTTQGRPACHRGVATVFPARGLAAVHDCVEVDANTRAVTPKQVTA